MFKIYDGREYFYQWDLDRKLIVGDRTIQAVHFSNRTSASAITRYCYDVNGMWLVDVPNLCLQESYRLKVYGFSAAKYTTVSSQFDVKSRAKPDGYVYTDDEVNYWQDLDQRVTGNTEDIAALKSLSDTYATEEYVNAAVANAGGGMEIVNASGAEIIELDKTYEEIMAMIEAGKVVVINYDGNLYHQFSDRPAFRYVGEAETRYIGFNPRDYSVRYSEAVLPTFEDVGTIVEGYLEGYAKTTDIPDVSNFQTAEQVNAAIEAYVGTIENAAY